MLLSVGIVLAVIWLLAVLVFKVTRGLIHLALLIAIVLVVLHFARVMTA